MLTTKDNNKLTIKKIGTIEEELRELTLELKEDQQKKGRLAIQSRAVSTRCH